MVQAPDRTDIDPEVKEFVINVLGCQCPEEVFDTIDYTWNRDLAAGHMMIIGDRLLVNIVVPEAVPEGGGAGPLIGHLLKLLTTGRKERDSRRLNRFRLVLVSRHEDVDNLEDLSRLALVEFERTNGIDDKVHIHVVDVEGLPKNLRRMVQG